LTERGALLRALDSLAFTAVSENMKTKPILAAILLTLIGGIILGALFSHNRDGGNISPQSVGVKKIEGAPPADAPAATTVSPAQISMPGKAVEKPVIRSDSQKQVAGNSSKPPKEIQDPDARAALSLVGADPVAEQYWAAAINDPNLPANERKDLIEDLNEDGLSDPKHPGPQDLPLIVSRLQLIEEMAPNAMDDVNANAFAEAYKDLVNLAQGGTAQ
jgi:hypothetical protein